LAAAVLSRTTEKGGKTGKFPLFRAKTDENLWKSGFSP
jgi:hypothetical protein